MFSHTSNKPVRSRVYKMNTQKGGVQHMKKTLFVFSFLGLLALGIIYMSIGVSASPADYGNVLQTMEKGENGEYALDDMLEAALLDEYLAQATYAKIIEQYGEVRPFSKIILAEQQHIDLLLPLFEMYGVAIPENTMINEVVLPESIASALATGVEAEKANIAMYEAFLQQGNLPDDVRDAFESLQAASEHHLSAFSRDRLNGAGYDAAYRIRNQWRRGGQGQGQGQHKTF